MVDSSDSTPAYLQVVASIRDAINNGNYQPGDRLPARHELINLYGVAHMTINRALDVLRREGLIASQQGRGVFVVGPQQEGGEGDRIDALEARIAVLERQVAGLLEQ
jgi:DNA-binding GntR family transcriptional regulator